MFHIVDDIPELRDILQELVKHAGYKCMQFDSAEAYLQYFNSAVFVPPIAILSDYMMAGKTGLELVKKLRERLPHLKAVIISGTPCAELDASIESYLCYSLSKPYRIEELFSLLAALEECDLKRETDKPTFHALCRYKLEHECPFHPDLALN